MNQTAAVREFLEKVENLYEVEYGDFKRKVGLYLNRMESQLQDPPARVSELCGQIRMKVVYDPSGDIEPSRVETVQLAEEILKALGGRPEADAPTSLN